MVRLRMVGGFIKAGIGSLSRAIGMDAIAVDELPEDAANRLRRQQMRGAIEQMRVFVVGNTMFAPVLGFQAWGIGVDWLVVAWTSVMLLFSWWLFWRWIRSYHTDGKAADMDRFVNETKVNASIWCVGMVLFFPLISGDSKTILVSVMIGSLALGTLGFSQAPRAAFWYLAITASVMVLVPIFVWWMDGTRHNLLMGVLAVVAGGAIFNATLERAKAQMRAFRNHEALVQKTEVVDLLLKDYEQQRNEWIWRSDADGKLITCPVQVLDLLRVDAADLRATDLVRSIQNATRSDGTAEVKKICDAFEDKIDLNDVTLPLRDPACGAHRWIVMKGRPQFEAGRFAGYRGIFADASATVEAKRRVEYLASHDPLTGVKNRNFLHARLEALDPNADRAIIYLVDLDGFKQINDGYGHAIGDKLLQEVANRLKKTTGPDALVARLGGDEFMVLVETPQSDVLPLHQDLGKRLLQDLSRPFVIGRLDIGISGSIGVARYPTDTTHGPTLMNQADLALYAAKRGGRNKCVTFAPRMMDGLQRRMMVTDRLRRAVQDRDIQPHYQTQHCAETGKLVGAEALARWTDDELGPIGPDVFIPIAEETGLIHELGEQLLRRACLDALTWPLGVDQTPLTLAVNLSPVQVMRGNVVAMVKRVLMETGFPPDRLEIEITEGVLIDDVPATRFLLEELADAGISIALDDFGTGYSSLSYVRALPLNRLKIDRSFVFEIEAPEAQSIVSAIVSLCQRLNLEVVAEGVENREGHDILADLGCDVLQGYYFSRPLSALDFRDLIEAHPGLSLEVSSDVGSKSAKAG